jgi:hypothetical protein
VFAQLRVRVRTTREKNDAEECKREGETYLLERAREHSIHKRIGNASHREVCVPIALVFGRSSAEKEASFRWRLWSAREFV